MAYSDRRRAGIRVLPCYGSLAPHVSQTRTGLYPLCDTSQAPIPRPVCSASTPHAPEPNLIIPLSTRLSMINHNLRPTPMPHDLSSSPLDPIRESETTLLTQLCHHMSNHATLQCDGPTRADGYRSSCAADQLRAFRSANVVLRAEIARGDAEQLFEIGRAHV